VEFGNQRGFDYPAADFAAGRGERGDVFDIETGEALLDAPGQSTLGDELLERVRRGRITARDRDSESGQVSDHLAKRGILAADLAEIGKSQRIQPQNHVAQGGSPGIYRSASLRRLGPRRAGRQDAADRSRPERPSAQP